MTSSIKSRSLNMVHCEYKADVILVKRNKNYEIIKISNAAVAAWIKVI